MGTLSVATKKEKIMALIYFLLKNYIFMKHAKNPGSRAMLLWLCLMLIDSLVMAQPDSSPQITLLPLEHSTYLSTGTDRPVFRWHASSERNYTYRFRLYQITDTLNPPKQIYEAQTQQTKLAWPDEVAWPKGLTANQSRQYEWTVEITGIRSTAFSRARGLFSVAAFYLDIQQMGIQVECADTAYDPAGNACFLVTENWEIENTYSSTGTFVSHQVTTQPSGLPVTPTYINSPPATIPANSTQIVQVQYTICVPLGENFVSAVLEYQSSLNTTTETQAQSDSLIVCQCEICDEWEIRANNQLAVPWVNRMAVQDYLYIEDLINVSPPSSSGPIVQVEAEIIWYEHFPRWGDPPIDSNACFTCNQLDPQHGTFIPYTDIAGVDLSNLMSTGFGNQDRARYRGTSSLAPSRDAIWQSLTPAGVSMPLTSKLTIGVPNYSDDLIADCCEDLFKIWIRYSFTARNPDTGECTVCSTVVYYEITRNDTTIQLKTDPQPFYNN